LPILIPDTEDSVTIRAAARAETIVISDRSQDV